eukprot:5693170-Karenia_brevis.AAC.1
MTLTGDCHPVPFRWFSHKDAARSGGSAPVLSLTIRGGERDPQPSTGMRLVCCIIRLPSFIIHHLAMFGSCFSQVGVEAVDCRKAYTSLVLTFWGRIQGSGT